MTAPKVIFENANGDRREVVSDAPGMSVMEFATKHSIHEIIGECGGSLSCATCHAYIDPAWTQLVPPPGEDELAMLDGALNRMENSRLTCQVVVTDDLDGLVVHLPDAQY